MDCSTYAKELKSLEKLRCQYCGSTVLTYGGSTFCHICEGLVLPAASPPEPISEAYSMFASGKIADAKEVLSGACKGSQNARLLFGAANIFDAISDWEYSGADYGRPGFMYENSNSIYASLDTISKSKEMLYKSIKLLLQEYTESKNAEASYLLFAANIKLKRKVYAFRQLAELEEEPSKYANMVYAAEYSEKSAKAHIDSLLGKHVNSLYYLSKYLIHLRKFKAASDVLDAINSNVFMPKAAYLMQRLKLLLEETRL